MTDKRVRLIDGYFLSKYDYYHVVDNLRQFIDMIDEDSLDREEIEELLSVVEGAFSVSILVESDRSEEH